MSALALAVRQVRYENRSFWRNPAAAFFTFLFPLMFLVIFTTVFSDDAVLPTGETVDSATYYTASILAFAIITAAYVNIAMAMTFARDEGVLKRIRGTPLPAWSYFAGKIGSAVYVQLLLVIITVLFGVVFYDVDIPTSTAPAFLVILIVGAAAFSSLGVAITSLVPNAEAAPAVINFSVLPVEFLSGVFFPVDNEVLSRVADFFPVKHFLEATFASYLGTTTNGWEAVDLTILAAWGVAGVALAIRFFSWEPRR